MLFLKNVETVEVLEWALGKRPRASSRAPPSATRRPRFARRAARSPARPRRWRRGPPRNLTANTRVTFETEGEDEDDDARSTRPTPRARTFFVSQALGENLAPLVTANREKYGMKLVPWAAVAAELAPKTRATETTKNVERTAEDDDGRAVLFFAPPRAHRSPVHVNAYFELSSNRRDIWFGEDMAGGGAARSESGIERCWNAVAAPAYARLIIAEGAFWDPRATFTRSFPASPRPRRGARWWRERAPSSATRPCFTPPRTAGDGSPRGGGRTPIARRRPTRRWPRRSSTRASSFRTRRRRCSNEWKNTRCRVPSGSVRAAFDARFARRAEPRRRRPWPRDDVVAVLFVRRRR